VGGNGTIVATTGKKGKGLKIVGGQVQEDGTRFRRESRKLKRSGLKKEKRSEGAEKRGKKVTRRRAGGEN